MPQVFEGLRVVDVTTGPVGGIATMVLADFGADVIKVEQPGGDRFRALAAAPLWLRGKRSVELDLARPDAREDLDALIATADVLVVSGPPSRARRGAGRGGPTAARPPLGHRRRRHPRPPPRPGARVHHRVGVVGPARGG